MPSIDDLPPPRNSRAPKGGIDDLPPPPKKAKPVDKAAAAQAALEHFGNAASAGYLPQLQAIAGEFVPNPTADVDAELAAQGFKVSEAPSNYLASRDANIKRLERHAQEHPYASAAGSVAGALTTAVPAGAAMPIKAASRIGRMLQAAGAGAVLGAVANPGDKEGVINPLQTGERARNAATGAGFGLAGQGVIEGASKAAKAFANLPNSLKAKAEERAFKSSGAMLRDYRKAAGGKQDKISEYGRVMLDEGLIQPGMAVDDVAEAAKGLVKKKGEEIERVLKELGEHEAKVGGQVKRSDLAGEIRKGLVKEGDLPSTISNNKYYSDLVDAFERGVSGEDLQKLRAAASAKGKDAQKSALAMLEQAKGEPQSIGALQKMKKAADEQINWNRLPDADIPKEEQFNRAVYHAAKEALEKRAETLADAVGRTDYKALKKSYGAAKEIGKISKDSALRKNALNFLSPTDYFSTGAGAVVGAASGNSPEEKLKNAALGASLGMLNKAKRTYVTPMVSKGLDAAGRLLAKTPISAAGELAAPVLNAAEKSPAAATNTVRLLTRPRLERAIPMVAEEPDRKSASAPLKGEDRWAQAGAAKLGITDPARIDQLKKSKQGKRLLIEASDLKPGKAMDRIKSRIKEGWER